MAPHLTAALGEYPHTAPIITGAVSDSRVTLDLIATSSIVVAFAPMVRRQAYDLSEMAIVTALQALDYGKPIILLPIVLNSRFQRKCLVGYRPNGLLHPCDLVGRTIGVRSYTQTTGVWVRAALFEDFGIAADSIRWRTQDGAHVEEYQDPPFVEHDTTEASLLDQLKAGQIDAAIFGNDMPTDPDIVPLIPNHDEADRLAYARNGFMPVNHMVCVSTAAAQRAPEAVRGIFDMFVRAIAETAPRNDEPRAAYAGFDQVRPALEFTLEQAKRQGLIGARLSIQDVLAPALALLGGQ